MFFAYIGFDTVTVASEEAKRPGARADRHHRRADAGRNPLRRAHALHVGVTLWDRLSNGAAMLDALSAVTKNHALYWIVAIGGIAGNTTVMLTIAARSGAHLLRDGARPYAAAGRRADPSGVSDAGAHDRDHRFIVAIFAAYSVHRC